MPQEAPTMGDLAWNEALNARRRLDAIETRLDGVEVRVLRLEETLSVIADTIAGMAVR